MKKYLFFSFVLFFSINSFSQEITKKEIIGLWKVIEIIDEPKEKSLKNLIKGFRGATFDFEESGNFILNSTDKTNLFNVICQQTKNSKWIFLEEEQIIKIGTIKDKYSIMHILLKSIDNQIFMSFLETNLTLKISKYDK